MTGRTKNVTIGNQKLPQRSKKRENSGKQPHKIFMTSLAHHWFQEESQIKSETFLLLLEKPKKKKKGAKETKESKRKDTVVTCAKSIYFKVEL